MRIAVINQRLSLIQGTGAVDVHAASGGRFGPDAAGSTSAGPSSPTGPRRRTCPTPSRSRPIRSARRRRRRGRCSASG